MNKVKFFVCFDLFGQTNSLLFMVIMNMSCVTLILKRRHHTRLEISITRRIII